jgi:co-chaperonin GroES (HSP10)
MKIRAINDNILCVDGDFGEQVTQSGIIIQNTSGKEEGIYSRWFKVFEVGPDIDWLTPGQWVYVEYGRWTEAMKLSDDRFETDDNKADVWKVDPKGCLAVADEKPDGVSVADVFGDVYRKQRD